VVTSTVSSEGGSVTAKDTTPFAGLPAVFMSLRKGDIETNIFGLIAGNRIYLLDAKGPNFENADFPHFRNSFKLN
jgi:hypothetical protein